MSLRSRLRRAPSILSHGYDHFAYQCPTRSLLLDEIHADEDHKLEEVVYDHTGDFTDAEEDLKKSGTHLNVIVCLHATSREDDWRKSSVSQTYFTHECKNYKVMIDGDSCVNIISTIAIEKIGFKAKSHPQPYNVTWVDKNFHSNTQCRFMPIKFLSYHARIWCDVLPMDAAHILLGRPWLYDLDVTSFGKSNTNTFLFNGKKIVLTLLPTRFKLTIKRTDR